MRVTTLVGSSVLLLSGLIASCGTSPTSPTSPTPSECPSPRLVTANLSGDTTWENWVSDPDCFDYVVESDIQTNAGTLTIEAGTVVGVEEGIGIRLRFTSMLIADGTEADPIVLTGTTKERGFWKGLSLETNSDEAFEHVLRHVTIEFTGGAAISRAEDASLMLMEEAVARIEHATFRESSGYGVSLASPARIVGPDGNAFTQNALGAAWADGQAVPSLNGAVLTGNDVDVVVVRPNTVVEAASWPSATYRILRATNPQAFTVLESGELTVAAGSVFRFEGDQSMLVLGGLSAIGTAAAPVVFTGTEPQPGHWGGLAFVGSAHPMNRLEHAVVEYGGGRSIGTASERASLALVPAGAGTFSRVTIQNSSLRGSAEYGLRLHAGSQLPAFTGNELTQNQSAPAHVHAPVVDELTLSNVYGGNDNDEIIVQTGSGMTITEAATWLDLGVPYHLQYSVGPVTVVQAALTIEPGVEMRMAPGLGISMRDGGSMTAEGTEQNRITMEAKSAPWQGLDFLDSAGSFDYIDVTGGGSAAWGMVNEPGTITIRAASSGSLVAFTGNVTLSGAAFGIAFSYGDSFATGCPGSVYIPPPDTFPDHCLPD